MPMLSVRLDDNDAMLSGIRGSLPIIDSRAFVDQIIGLVIMQDDDRRRERVWCFIRT